MSNKLTKTLNNLNDALRQLNSATSKLKAALKELQPVEVVWGGNSNEGEDLTGFHGVKRIDVVQDAFGYWSAYYNNMRIAQKIDTRDEAEELLMAYIDAEK